MAKYREEAEPTEFIPYFIKIHFFLCLLFYFFLNTYNVTSQGPNENVYRPSHPANLEGVWSKFSN